MRRFGLFGHLSGRSLPYAQAFVTKDPHMLILTRRVGETLRIGNDVVVTVLAVHGNQVRIGIDAPRTVAVHREEVYRRLAEERDESHQS